MTESMHDHDAAQSGPRGTSELMERLIAVRKRKRAFAGQAPDAEAIERRLREEQRRERDR
jgi:hypothetical protein